MAVTSPGGDIIMTDKDALFPKIRDTCTRCLERPSVEGIQSLKQLISSLHPPSVKQIQLYLLFPIQDILSDAASVCTGKLQLICETCQCLQVLLEKSTLESFQVFADFFVTLFWLSDDRVNKSCSQDMKASCIEAAYDLVKFSTLSVIREAMNTDLFTRVLSQAVSVLVSAPILSKTNNPSKSLQITCLKTLEILLNRCQTLRMMTDQQQQSSASVIRGNWNNFLPGISVSILKLLAGDDKNPQGLVVASLSVLKLVVTASFPLELQEDIMTEMKNSKERNEELRQTSQNLGTIISKLSTLFITNRWSNVRTALLSLSTDIVTESAPALLDQLQEVLFNIPITLSTDEDEGVRNKAKQFLEEQLAEGTLWRDHLTDNLESKVMSLMERMEESIESVSQDEKLNHLQFISGLMSVMRRNRDVYALFLSTPKTRNQLIRFLMTMSRVKDTDLGATPVTPVGGGGGDFSNAKDDDDDVELLYFPSKDEEKAKKVLITFMKDLSSHLDVELVVDVVTDITDLHIPSAEAVFFLNHLLGGVESKNDRISLLLRSHSQSCCQILRSILEMESSTSHRRQQTLSSSSSSVTKTVIALQGVMVGFSTDIDRSSDRDDYCLDAADVVIRSVSFERFNRLGRKCLLLIASHSLCGDKRSEAAFILDNFSFFIQSLERNFMKLSSLNNSNRLPLYLKTLLSFCDSNDGGCCLSEIALFSLLHFTERLLSLLDSCYSIQPGCLLEATLVLTRFLAEGDNGDEQSISWDWRQDKIPDDVRMKHAAMKMSDFNSKWKEFVQSSHDSTNFDGDEIQSEPEPIATAEEADDGGDTWKRKELPPRIRMIHMILDRVSKLMSTPDPGDRATVIRVISSACLLLSGEEDLLLPLVHRVWRPLVTRLRDDSDVGVSRLAFIAINILSRVCGDFVRRRMSQDVVPILVSFLNQTRVKEGAMNKTKGKNNNSRIAHRTTATTITFKYQEEALEGLGSLVLGIELEGGSKLLWDIIECLSSYARNPVERKELQEAASHSLNLISILDEEAVWFYHDRNHQP